MAVASTVRQPSGCLYFVNDPVRGLSRVCVNHLDLVQLIAGGVGRVVER